MADAKDDEVVEIQTPPGINYTKATEFSPTREEDTAEFALFNHGQQGLSIIKQLLIRPVIQDFKDRAQSEDKKQRRFSNLFEDQYHYRKEQGIEEPAVVKEGNFAPLGIKNTKDTSIYYRPDGLISKVVFKSSAEGGTAEDDVLRSDLELMILAAEYNKSLARKQKLTLDVLRATVVKGGKSSVNEDKIISPKLMAEISR